MKPYLQLFAAAAVACTAQAQDQNAPQPPPPPGTPPPGEHQPPRPPREPRFPAPERGPDQRRPEDQRGPEQRDGNDRHENAGPRGPQRDGGPGGERRDQFKPEGRDGNRDGERDGHRDWSRGPNLGGPGHPPMMPGMAPQPTPFLGVMTMQLPEPLNAQLKIPVGFGLIVGEVLPDSPAAKAGIKKFDVLKLLNDQQLSEPGQLQALVRAAGKDKEVTLTLVREAQERKVTVKIGERMAPPPGAGFMGHRFGEEAWQRAREMQERARALGGEAGERARELQERVRTMGPEAAERAREFQEKARRYREQNGARPPSRPDGEHPEGERPKSSAANGPEEMLRRLHAAGGNVQISSENSVSTKEGASSRLHFSDNDVEIEVAGENGHRTLKARSRDGQQIFDGPIDTPEQRESIPQPIREKLERIRLRPGVPGAEANASSSAKSDGPPPELGVQ